MKRVLFISIICFFATLYKADAQPPRIILVSEGGDLFLLDTTGGACSYVPYGTVECLDTANFANLYSIALYKDTLYANDSNGNLYQSVMGANPYCALLRTQVFSVALTVDKDGNLFWFSAEDSLITYNPHTNKIRALGRLNYSPAGDLIFYQDRLLLSSIDDKLIEINIEHPEQSFLRMDPRHLFFGLANTNQDCTQHIIFGFEPAGDSSRIIELDLNTNSVTGLYCTLPFVVFDAASEKESGGYDCYCHVYVPTAFSPNHDGLNDIFRPVVRCPENAFLSEFIFRIFNRWGQLIFSTQDQNTGWAGSISGKQQDEGMYVWELMYKNAVTGNKMKQKGSFMLLK